MKYEFKVSCDDEEHKELDKYKFAEEIYGALEAICMLRAEDLSFERINDILRFWNIKSLFN